MSESDKIINDIQNLCKKYLYDESIICEEKDINCYVSVEEVEHFLFNLFLGRSQYH